MVTPLSEARNPKKPGKRGFTEAMIRAALRKHAGVYSFAARELGCDRANIQRRIERSPALQEFCRQIDAEVDDLATGIIVDTLGRKETIGGRPTKEAQAMARWLKDHKQRGKGLSVRLSALGKGADGAPAAARLQVTVEYVDAPQEDEEEVDVL